MGLFIISLLLIGLGLLIVFLPKSLPGKAERMRPGGIVSLIIGIFILASSMFVIIDAGERGVIVVLGKVSERILENGPHLVVPWADIVKYPVRLREVTLSGNAGITIKDSSGLETTVDLTLMFYVDENNLSHVYSGVAKNTDDLENNILIPFIRSVTRDVCGNYKFDEILSEKRDEIRVSIFSNLITAVSDKGIVVDSVLIRSVDVPETINVSIQAKLSAEQEALQAEYEKQKAEIEAEIKIIEADGLAAAQQIINSTLTPYYLQHEAIEAYTELAGSDNTTFIILPTSPDASGIPIILDGVR